MAAVPFWKGGILSRGSVPLTCPHSGLLHLSPCSCRTLAQRGRQRGKRCREGPGTPLPGSPSRGTGGPGMKGNPEGRDRAGHGCTGERHGADRQVQSLTHTVRARTRTVYLFLCLTEDQNQGYSTTELHPEPLLFFCLETGSHSIVQAGLELAVLLLQPLE